MPFPLLVLAANDVVQVRIRSTYLGQQILTVMHYQASSSGTASVPFVAAMESLHELLTDAGGDEGWVGRISALQIPQCTMDYVEYQVVKPFRQVFIQLAGMGPGTGAVTAGGLPSNTSATFTLAPTVAKRGAHSTFKLAGLDRSVFTGNRLTAAAFNALIDITDAMMIPIAITGGFELSPGSLPKEALNPFRQWAVSRVGQNAHVMRRRTAGLGI